MSGKDKAYKRSHIRDRKRQPRVRIKKHDATVETDYSPEIAEAMEQIVTGKVTPTSVRIARNGVAQEA